MRAGLNTRRSPARRRRQRPKASSLHMAATIPYTAATSPETARPCAAHVTAIQRLLNQRLMPRPRLRVDGDFEPRTEAAMRLGIDGVVGTQTRRALETALRERAPTPSAPSTPWTDASMKELGQRKIRGEEHNPRIVEYHATATLRASSDETAWCSSFVNRCLIQAGLGTSSAGASPRTRIPARSRSSSMQTRREA